MFCRICGNEVNEQAVVCPKCGCAIDDAFAKKKVKEKNDDERNKIEDVDTEFKDTSKACIAFNYVSVGLICLTLMFGILSIAYGWIDAHFVNGYSYAYYYPYFGLALTAFISSLVMLGFSITSFVLGFKNKSKRNISDILFIVSIFIFIFVIIVMIISQW
ncbi:MAG: hypothetical protein IKC71_03195 [Clostridia bacterium]|nr:hypothetical protein [Clostridia bacterium]